jgi:hypothetical protein
MNHVWNVFITEDRTTIRKATVALSSYLEGDLHAGRLNVASTKLPRALIFSLKGMSKVKASSIYHLLYYQSCWRFDWQEVKVMLNCLLKSFRMKVELLLMYAILSAVAWNV